MLDLYTYFIYVTLLIAVILLSRIDREKIQSDSFSSRKYRLSLRQYVGVVLIAFIVGFRHQVGTDWLGYVYYFESLSGITTPIKFYRNFEPGYHYINKLFSYYGLGHQWAFFTLSAISWFLLYKSIPGRYLTFWLFFLFAEGFFFWSMNGVRQFIAISFVLFSIQYLIRKQKLHYFAGVLLASLFHYTALFFVVFYFIPYKSLYNQKAWLAIFLLSFFASSVELVNTIINLIAKAFDQIGLISHYLRFVETPKVDYQEDYGMGYGVLFRNIVSFFIILYSRRLIREVPESKLYFLLFFIGVVAANIFFSIQVFERFNMYFLFFRPFVLALIIRFYWHKEEHFVFTRGTVVLFAFNYLYSIFSSSSGCSPYSFGF